MPHRISLNPSHVARVLSAAAVLLVLASVAGEAMVRLSDGDMVHLLAKGFNVNREGNFPAAFSTLLLLIAALLLAVISILKRKQAEPLASYWAILCIGFLFMAIDEAVSLHELLITPGRKLLGGEDLGVFYFAWVVPGIALVLALGLFFLRFLARLPPRTRQRFLLAAALYLGGAIGFEMVGGFLAEDRGVLDLAYVTSATVEESLEMAGAVVFIRALLVYLADNYREVRFEFERAPGGKAA